MSLLSNGNQASDPGLSCSAQRNVRSDNVNLEEPSYTNRENWAENFRISVNKFSNNLRKLLKGPQPLSVPLRRQFVREAVNMIQQENPKPGRDNLRKIVGSLVDDYPCLVFVTYTGRKIAGGDSGLLGCLEARIETVNKAARARRDDANSSEEDDPEALNVPPKRAKRKIDMYGCIEGMYCPDSLPPGETKESQENSRQVMLALRDPEGTVRNLMQAQELIADTYVTQRWIVTDELPIENEANLISVLMEDFPLMFVPSCANVHMKMLTGIDMIQKLRDFLSDDANDFIQFLITNATSENAWEYVKKKKDLDSWKECGFKDTQILCLLELICLYFGEDIGMIFRVEEVSISFSLVQQYLL